MYYSTIYWYHKSIFGGLGNRSRISSSGLRLEHPENIFIGDRVYVGENSWLAASPHTESLPELIIKRGCAIGRFNQIYSTTSITLEEYVLTADRVFISESAHGFQDVNVPIMHQKITSKGPIIIGSGTWIGINACIIGASVGKNCVIGANSVVTKNIPDNCIVGGNPSTIIKRYNLQTEQWVKVDQDGNFLT